MRFPCSSPNGEVCSLPTTVRWPVGVVATANTPAPRTPGHRPDVADHLPTPALLEAVHARERMGRRLLQQSRMLVRWCSEHLPIGVRDAPQIIAGAALRFGLLNRLPLEQVIGVVLEPGRRGAAVQIIRFRAAPENEVGANRVAIEFSDQEAHLIVRGKALAGGGRSRLPPPRCAASS